MHVYLDVSLSWRLNASVLATGAYGSFCDVKVFTLITSGYTGFIVCKAWV